MNKDKADKQKKDKILRAKDIIPPYNRNISQEQNRLLKDDFIQDADANVETENMLSSNNEELARQKVEIPQFDLAGQILSEQRKIASIKRQKPSKKNKKAIFRPKTLSTDSTFKPPAIISQQGKIIAEIVARDIQKLRKSNI
jgi:hypothetical protein